MPYCQTGMVPYSSKWLCFFILIASMLIYIFLMLSITIIFKWFLWQHNPFGERFCHLGLVQPLGFSLHLLNPYCSLAGSYMIRVCWLEGMNHFVLSIGSSWITCQYFQVWTMSHFALFLFRAMLEYSRHVSVLAIWQASWDTIVGSFFVECFCAKGHGQPCQLCCVI